jgi:trehalose utilization protein
LINNFIFYFSDEHELDDCQIDENTKKILINNIRRRLTPQAVKCRAGKF